MTNVYEEEKFNREHQGDAVKAPDSGELKTADTPCKYCNMDVDSFEPLCGDENEGDSASIGRDKDGYHIEYWQNFSLLYSAKIYYCPMCNRKLEVK